MTTGGDDTSGASRPELGGFDDDPVTITQTGRGEHVRQYADGYTEVVKEPQDSDRQRQLFRYIIDGLIKRLEDAKRFDDMVPELNPSWFTLIGNNLSYLQGDVDEFVKAFMIYGIVTGNLTRRQVAEFLKIHENTPARWVKAPENEKPTFTSAARNFGEARLHHFLAMLNSQEADIISDD